MRRLDSSLARAEEVEHAAGLSANRTIEQAIYGATGCWCSRLDYAGRDLVFGAFRGDHLLWSRT